MIDAQCHADHRAVVHCVFEVAVAQDVNDAAHRFFGIVLYVLHIRVHHIETEVADHAAQFLHAFFIGSDHGAQVSEVLRDVAAGPRA